MKNKNKKTISVVIIVIILSTMTTCESLSSFADSIFGSANNRPTARTGGASGSTAQSADPEWQLMLDRINLLVDNHFENRDFDEGQKTNWNITGLSVGIYKKRQDGVF